MVASVVQGYIDVENVAIDEYSLIWYAMADNLINRRADGFREVDVVERRRVGLEW
jgi:hypothetical protein